MSLESIQIITPNFRCDTDGGSDSPATAYQDLPPGPDTDLHPEIRSNQYKCLLLISDRQTPVHLFSIPFQCTLKNPKKKDKMQEKIHINTEQKILDQDLHMDKTGVTLTRR